MNHFDLLRGLHIIAVIAWMAGMMYLPRLFAYHTETAPPGTEFDAHLIDAASVGSVPAGGVTTGGRDCNTTSAMVSPPWARATVTSTSRHDDAGRAS